MNKRKILGVRTAPSTSLGISPAGLRRPQARLNFDFALEGLGFGKGVVALRSG
jgi:hypothetical protein